MWDPKDYIKAWPRSHRCASSDKQIRTASQKPTLKQEDPVWKFLYANAHFIRTIWCSIPFGVGTPFPDLFFSIRPTPMATPQNTEVVRYSNHKLISVKFLCAIFSTWVSIKLKRLMRGFTFWVREHEGR